MAVRLSVVMVHTPPPSAGASQLAEAIVGELIGMHEIDLTLVGNLPNISHESTDLLSLESLSGDVAVLDWQPPTGIVSALAELGFEGSRTPHTHDPQAPAAAEPTRRIYAFDLNQFPDACSLCAAVGDLKAKRQVRTFSLSSLAAVPTPPGAVSPKTTGAVSPKTTGAVSPKTLSPKTLSPKTTAPAAPKATAPAAPKKSQKPDSPHPAGSLPPSGTRGSLPGPPPAARTRDSLDLDELLDRLDELDP